MTPVAAPTASAAGDPHALARPELGLWALAVPETPADVEEAAAVLADLAALDPDLPHGDAARLVRRRLEQEALRLGHRRAAQGHAGGVAIIVALASLPHVLCFRIGGGGIYRLAGSKLALLAFTQADAAGSAPPVETLRTQLDPGTALAFVSPAVARTIGDGSHHAVAASMPPAAAARFLAQRVETAQGAPSTVMVLAAPAALEPATPKPPDPPPSPPAPRPGSPPPRSNRGAFLALATVAVVVVGALAAVAVYTLQPVEAPQPGRPDAAPQGNTADVALSAPGLPPALIASADRRLAQTARLAVAVSAIEAAFRRLGLETDTTALPLRPFAPAALDRRAAALAARLPTLPLATPIRTEYRLSSPFGFRIHPITGVPKLHAGQDLVGPPGTPLFATGTGKVDRAGPAGGYGNLVEIQMSDGLFTRYAHMDSIAVTVGQQVTAGTVVGVQGATGDVTGPHLHYEIRRGDSSQPIDPMPFLEAGQALKTILEIAIRN